MINFGRKSVTSRTSARIRISETNIVEEKGAFMKCWLSEYAMEKLISNHTIRVRILFKGTNNTKRIDYYTVADIPVRKPKMMNRGVRCLVKLRKVG
jgi:hypothetical protein